jgi:hypothetical protein
MFAVGLAVAALATRMWGASDVRLTPLNPFHPAH